VATVTTQDRSAAHRLSRRRTGDRTLRRLGADEALAGLPRCEPGMGHRYDPGERAVEYYLK
jgi:hypothetical protein